MLCQQDSLSYRIDGVIKDKHGAVVPGLSLSIEKDGKAFEKNGYGIAGFTDIYGKFSLELQPGNYEITASGIPDSQFRFFLRIDEKGPKPQHVDIAIDPSALCDLEKTSPALKHSAIPRYPPAARAVRTVGTVTVTVKIRPDGSVSSAKAILGHPLLRKASEVVAAEFSFESSHEDAERTSTIRFVFLDAAYNGKPVKRFDCPKRILVEGDPPTIYTTTDTH